MLSQAEAIMIGGHPLTGVLQGATYKVGILDGWWSRPAVKRNVVPRELADGDFPSPRNYEARYITIGGSVECEHHEQMHHIIDQLNGLATVRSEYMSVQGHGVTQSALVEADDTPILNPVTDKRLDFTLYFKAPDPLKYGEVRTASMGASWTDLRHWGNYPATPTFRLYALGVGDAGFTVAGDMPDGQRRVWWYNSWTNNAWHDIDFATGSHRVAGNSARSNVRQAQVWQIPPGETIPTRTIPRTSAGGTISGTVTWRDTWI